VNADARLERTVEDAVARVRRGDAVFLPVTPTMTTAALVAAVRRVAVRLTVSLTIDEQANGILVAQRSDDS